MLPSVPVPSASASAEQSLHGGVHIATGEQQRLDVGRTVTEAHVLQLLELAGEPNRPISS